MQRAREQAGGAREALEATRRRRLVVAINVGVLSTAVALGVAATAGGREGPPHPRAPEIAVSLTTGLALVRPGDGLVTALSGTLPGDAQPSWSPDGRHVAFVRDVDGNSEIFVLDAWDGTATRLTLNSRADDTNPAWSPDGKSIAWASGARGQQDVFVMAADGGHKRRLVRADGNDVEPAWLPDGSALVYASNRDGSYALRRVTLADRTDETLLDEPGDELAPSVSPNGRVVAYAAVASGGSDLRLLDLASATTRSLAPAASFDGQPVFSPDGSRVAFVSERGGTRGVWVVRAAGGRPARAVLRHAGVSISGWTTPAPPEGPEPRGGELLPDLDQRAPHGLEIIRSNGRWLLGFDSAVDNVGLGPLWFRGVRASTAVPKMTATQLVELRDGGVRAYRDAGRMEYTPHPPHYHWHYQPYERYELRREFDYAMVVRDRKTGFCLADHYGHAAKLVRGFGPPRFLGECGKNDRSLLRVEQGTSIGYTDRYGAFFHGQNVDITGVPSGRYVLVHRANPELVMREERYDNNAASLLIQLKWDDGTPRVRTLRRCDESERCGS